MFYVGQKVVCVDNLADTGRYWLAKSPPSKGKIYTVARFSRQRTYHNHSLLFLVELGAEHAYRATRFRPLTDQKKSISFTIGADPDSERWDNRRKAIEPAKGGV